MIIKNQGESNLINDTGRQTVLSTMEPILAAASWLLLAHALLWAGLLFRWVTFSSFGWEPFEFENGLVAFPPLIPYIIYGGGFVVDVALGILMLRRVPFARMAAIGRGVFAIGLALAYWAISREFMGAIALAGLAGLLLVLLTRQTAWSVNYPAAFWLIVFFVLPNVIVLLISLSERGPRGSIVYPDLMAEGIGALFNDYTRFFRRIGGQLLYLRIFWRSFWMASVNTIVCLLFGYPFAYWIARRPQKWRNVLIFLVMIPFWTNFLVRTYAWLLLLRDTGLINNIWTVTLHNAALALAGETGLFAWLASITADPLPLLFNQFAVFLGLFYGFFPFVVLPLYSNLEQLDWSLLEAASDLGANSFYSTTRVLLPLSLPGIVAAGIIVFVPSLGAYVTPAILGGGKVALLGNLIQQQFMTARDYPFGSAIGFLMMAIMLLAIMLYFRVAGENA